jgi:prepilin-type N-terminal cleavage/methylation domain-containing protein
MIRRTRSADGFTLLELVVALAIIGIASTVVLMAWRASAREHGSESEGLARAVADARRLAIASGRPQLMQFRLHADGSLSEVDDLRLGGLVVRMVSYPDGGVVADSSIPVERMSGSFRIHGRSP